MNCAVCDCRLDMRQAIRVEVSGPTDVLNPLFVIQYVCERDGRQIARALVPHAGVRTPPPPETPNIPISVEIREGGPQPRRTA